jgi:hypothetical protein
VLGADRKPDGALRQDNAPAPARKLDAAEGRERLTAQVQAWRAEGRRSFAIGELAGFRASVGRSRPWLYQALGEMEDQAVVERDDDKAAQWLTR